MEKENRIKLVETSEKLIVSFFACFLFFLLLYLLDSFNRFFFYFFLFSFSKVFSALIWLGEVYIGPRADWELARCSRKP